MTQHPWFVEQLAADHREAALGRAAVSRRDRSVVPPGAPHPRRRGAAEQVGWALVTVGLRLAVPRGTRAAGVARLVRT